MNQQTAATTPTAPAELRPASLVIAAFSFAVILFAVHPSHIKAADDPGQPERTLRQPYTFSWTHKASTMLLAEGHSTTFFLIVSGEPSETKNFAASELRRYLMLSTGAAFDVQVGEADAHQPRIVLSTSPVSGFTYSGQSPDGFAMKSINPTVIAIVGGSERALLYAVYDFLEKAVGIRFLSPVSLGEVIPQHERLQIPMFEDHEEPVFNWRRNHYCAYVRRQSARSTRLSLDHRYAVADWSVKNRYNVELGRLLERSPRAADGSATAARHDSFYRSRGGVIPLQHWTGHNLHALVPPTELFGTHPEYYPLDATEGIRVHSRGHLCMTNPDVADHIVSVAKQMFRDHPDQSVIGVYQEDGSRLWCQCSQCSTLSRQDPSYGTIQTDLNMALANAVATGIERDFPDATIMTYAYHETRPPPVRVKPRHNVSVEYCVSRSNSNACAADDSTTRRELRTWNEVLDHGLTIYDYVYSDFPYLSFMADDCVADDHRFYSREGASRIIHETGENWGLSGLKMYAAARLAWNPWLDLSAIKDDFYKSLYGPAALHLREFHERTQHVLHDGPRLEQHTGRNWPIFTAEDLAYLELRLNNAYLAVADPVYLARIHTVGKTLQYIRSFSNALLACERFSLRKTEGNATAALEALRLLDQWIRDHRHLGIVSLYNTRFTGALANTIRDDLVELETRSQVQPD